jgi:hypothetical protein
VRARTYENYRRRRGQDFAGLPDKFAALLDEVTAFADPLILRASSAQHWEEATQDHPPCRAFVSSGLVGK